MKTIITIYCKNTRQYYDVPCGTSLLDIYHQIGLQLPYPIVAARVNYKVQHLTLVGLGLKILSILPLIDILLGIIGWLVELYIAVGVVVAILVFLKVIKK